MVSAAPRRQVRGTDLPSYTVSQVLGLPDRVTACLFDLDGVLTQTAKVHAAAWKQTFDDFLRRRDETIDGLGNRKNELVLEMIRDQGVEPYEGSVRYVRAAIDAGLRRAVVSSSTNTRDVLKAAGISDMFEEIVDGVVAEEQHLKGKPAPDTYLAGARALAVTPAQAAVFEDALAGVEAGRAGHFGIVVGVDRVGQARALKAHGADVVVRDLADLLDAQ
jgi:HAD superfamily hydrolase (TIGR01509 family)